MYYRKPSPATLCAQDRRRREDESQRIAALFSDLAGLKITVEERGGTSSPKYIRRIVVASAPALFLIPCGDPHCSEGGHDITREILAALRDRKRFIAGTHDCAGTIGAASCHRSITFEAEAEFAEAKSTA